MKKAFRIHGIYRALAAMLCLLLCAACLLQQSFAADFDQTGERGCALTLVYEPDGYPVSGVSFRLYRVADVLPDVTYKLMEAYKGYNIWSDQSDWLTRASTLAGYVARDGLAADLSGTTQAGRLSFPELEQGLYLVLGSSYVIDDYEYTPVPCFLSLPATADGMTWEPNVEADVKYVRANDWRGNTTLQLRVVKQWEDESFEDERPEEVTVDLLQDGNVSDTAVLNAGNNWRHEWTGLSSASDWQVVERETEGYSTSVSQTGSTFAITNTYDDDPIDIVDPPGPPLIDKPDLPDNPDNNNSNSGGGKLPQTGQLWWPVPLLGLGGIVLLAAGGVRRKRWSGNGHAE